MTLARVYRAPSLQQEDRVPLSSYEDAVGRLVTLRIDASVTDEAYDMCVKLIADVFWQSDKRVRRDVRVTASKWGV